MRHCGWDIFHPTVKAHIEAQPTWALQNWLKTLGPDGQTEHQGGSLIGGQTRLNNCILLPGTTTHSYMISIAPNLWGRDVSLLFPRGDNYSINNRD
jgi:hypothetical protein